MGLVARNPAAEVKRPRQRQPLPRGLGPGELRLLLAAIPASPSGLRDRAIILTAVLRPSDAARSSGCERAT